MLIAIWPVDLIFVESIGQSLDEYLVNPVYFEEVMSDYGMKLVNKGDFQDLFLKQSAQNKVYGDMLKMEEDYQTYSFLNIEEKNKMENYGV